MTTTRQDSVGEAVACSGPTAARDGRGEETTAPRALEPADGGAWRGVDDGGTWWGGSVTWGSEAQAGEDRRTMELGRQQ